MVTNAGLHTQRGLSFIQQAALGLIPGVAYDIKFGNNSSIGTATTPEDVWEGGGVYTGQPVGVAETVDVYSDDVNDTAAGTGARTVHIHGLDASFVEQDETVTLNGTTHVASAGTYSRVYRMHVETAGSGGSNAGIITVAHTTTTADVFISTPVGANQSRVAAVTVPAGKRMLIIGMGIEMTRSGGLVGAGQTSLRCRDEGAVYRGVDTGNLTTAYSSEEDFQGGLVMAAKADIKWHVESVSDNNTMVAASLEYLLIDD